MNDEREWYYSEGAGCAQKGPVPAIVLSRLLEKGVGITPQTLIWKAGMETWMPIANVEPFQSIARFNSMQWYYVDIEGNQHGPILSKLLVHKLKEGEIDGLSLVYGGDLTEWKKVSEVQVLKDELAKIAEEEENMRLTFLKTEQDTSEMQKQVFVEDHDPRKAYEQAFPDIMKAQAAAAAGGGEGGSNTQITDLPADDLKTYIADNGQKYVWDEEENDWIEAEEEDEDAPVGDKATDSSKVVAMRATDKKRKVDASNDIMEGSDQEDDELNNSTANALGTGTGIGTEATAALEGDKPKKKRSKKKAKKGPNTWVYVSGLPPDVTPQEIKDHFSKVGLIALSPYDQQPKIKIYREQLPPNQTTVNISPDSCPCKGDCLLCYNAEESVKLAVDVLSGGYIRANFQITVTRADFSPSGNGAQNGGNGNGHHQHHQHHRPTLSQAQVKVAKSAIKQALTWNEDDDIGVAKAAALRIVVLEGLFKPEDFKDPAFSDELEGDIASECEKCGTIEKITLFSSNPRGIAVVKFSTSYAAQECIRLMNGRFFGGSQLKSYFWDGVTNYSVTVHSAQLEEEEEKAEAARLDEFGDWLENEQEDLPEEFKLRTE